MEPKFRIEGIYDKRTLKHLKLQGLKDFCFDFSPKSFNFVQEYVFFEQLLDLIDPADRIFLRFSRSNDPMVGKLIDDLKKAGRSLSNVYFEFDEWSKDVGPLDFSCNYLLNFAKGEDPSKSMGSNFRGFIFRFEFFHELYQSNLLNNFASNFYTRYHNRLDSENLMMLKMDWDSNLMVSLFELFEFNLLSIPINSKIEVCYRNVDLRKLSNEMEFLQKNNLNF